jgi:FixJ family two-component response regulator
VNPDHLFVGTQLENVADCIQKGRKTSPPVTDWQNRTTPHHWQRLTPAQVMEILTRVRAGELQERIAADYGINSRTVSKIKLGQRWPQLSGQ